MLSRPVPKASDRQRTLAGIRTTGRAACVIDGGGAARFIVDLVGALQDFNEDVVKL